MRHRSPQRFLFCAGAMLGILVGSPLAVAASPPGPGEPSPRQRLGKLLAATFFDIRDCKEIFGQLGLNSVANLKDVNEVGTCLEIVLRAIRNGDVAAIAAYSREFDNRGLLSTHEKDALSVLAALAEAGAHARGLAVESKFGPDFTRLRHGAKVLALWTADQPLATGLDGMITAMQQAQTQAGGAGRSRPPSGIALSAPPPPPDGPGGGKTVSSSPPRANLAAEWRLPDALRISGLVATALLKALADDDELPRDPAAIFQRSFGIALERDLGRPLGPDELDRAWKDWKSGRSLEQIVRALARPRGL